MRSAFGPGDAIFFKGDGAEPFIHTATKGAQNKFALTGYRAGVRGP